MVPVGDHAGPGFHELAHGRHGLGIVEPREAVLDIAVHGAPYLPGLEGARQDRAERVVAIFVEQEHRRQVRFGRAQQLQAIRLGPGEGPLVRPHDPLVVVRESQLTEEPDAFEALAVRSLVALAHDVVGGLFVPDEDATRAPGVQGLPDPAVVRSRFVGRISRQLEANRVVRIAIEEGAALVVRDHVVGRDDHPRQVDPVGVIAEGAKWAGSSHRGRSSSAFVIRIGRT